MRQFFLLLFYVATAVRAALSEAKALRSAAVDRQGDGNVEQAEAFWNGEETPENWHGDPAIPSAGDPEVHVELMGLMDTGTNLLQQMLWNNFPSMRFFASLLPASDAPEEKRIRYAEKGVWKHANLWTVNTHLRPWARENFVTKKTVLITMVRQPLSWLQSIKKAPYMLQRCVIGEDWLRRPCVHPIPSGHTCVDHEIPHNVTYTSLIDIWNKWTLAYKNAWSFMFSKLIILRYEDLVMEPVATMRHIAQQLNLTVGSDVWVPTQPAKSSGEPIGRAEAVTKIRTKSYLWQFTGAELHDACGVLNGEAALQLGYDDCKRIIDEADKLARAQTLKAVEAKLASL